MDVLRLLFFLAAALPGRSADPPVVVEVLFDEANPAASVAIMQDALLEQGDDYRNCRVISFEPDAVIALENQTEDTIKWIKEDGVKSKKGLHRAARHLFAVKQMKQILEAQAAYHEKFEDGFSPDLQMLVEQELLPDGFENWKKYHYRYEIVQAGFKQKLAIHQKPEPYFVAAAYPFRKGDYYFAMDEIGTIRFSRQLSEVHWGPVWDYTDPYGGPRQRIIR